MYYLTVHCSGSEVSRPESIHLNGKSIIEGSKVLSQLHSIFFFLPAAGHGATLVRQNRGTVVLGQALGQSSFLVSANCFCFLYSLIKVNRVQPLKKTSIVLCSLPLPVLRTTPVTTH